MAPVVATDPITFTFTEAASAARVTVKQLRAWVDNGVLAPEADTERAKDGWRRWSQLDVLETAIVGVIMLHRISPTSAAEIAGEVKAHLRAKIGHRKASMGVILEATRNTYTALVNSYENDGWALKHVPSYEGEYRDNLNNYFNWIARCDNYYLLSIEKIAETTFARMLSAGDADAAEARVA